MVVLVQGLNINMYLYDNKKISTLIIEILNKMKTSGGTVSVINEFRYKHIINRSY